VVGEIVPPERPPIGAACGHADTASEPAPPAPGWGLAGRAVHRPAAAGRRCPAVAARRCSWSSRASFLLAAPPLECAGAPWACRLLRLRARWSSCSR
jgi:hypothetical protein